MGWHGVAVLSSNFPHCQSIDNSGRIFWASCGATRSAFQTQLVNQNGEMVYRCYPVSENGVYIGYTVIYPRIDELQFWGKW